MLMMYGCLLIPEQKYRVLLELDISKGAGLDGIPPLILKNCASTFSPF
jgi:hypothetical protein